MSDELLTPAEAKDYLTLRQASERLGIKLKSVKQAAWRGRLRTRRVGPGRNQYGYERLVAPDEIERYRKEHLGNVGQPPKREYGRSS